MDFFLVTASHNKQWIYSLIWENSNLHSWNSEHQHDSTSAIFRNQLISYKHEDGIVLMNLFLVCSQHEKTTLSWCLPLCISAFDLFSKWRCSCLTIVLTSKFFKSEKDTDTTEDEHKTTKWNFSIILLMTSLNDLLSL